MKKVIICTCFALVSLSLAGCSTVEGAGRDLQDVSRAVQNKM